MEVDRSIHRGFCPKQGFNGPEGKGLRRESNRDLSDNLFKKKAMGKWSVLPEEVDDARTTTLFLRQKGDRVLE